VGGSAIAAAAGAVVELAERAGRAGDGGGDLAGGRAGGHRAGGGRRARHPRASSARRPGGGDAVVAEFAVGAGAAPLDLDVLAGRGERQWWCAGAAPLVAIALVAAVVAEIEPPHARHQVPSSTRPPGGRR
jgi:hypothetical protein